MSGPRILDLFAGPGGWDQGLAALGQHDVVGIEWDAAACATAIAAGHARIWAGIADMPTDAVIDAYGPFVGLIASPPCQAWSMAGNRKGEADRGNCHHLADRMALGDDSTDWTAWEDDRSPLVCQPVRWAREIRPEWICLEEVPAVASLWEHFARIFRKWGYSVWTGDLLAADYGVPQTRTRRILIARLLGIAAPPAPTHTKDPQGIDLFADELEPWISMAVALGWDAADSMHPARGEGMIKRHGERPDHSADEPAPTVISKSRSWERFVVDRRTNSKAAGGGMAPTVTVPITRPAPTFTGKSGTQWVIRPEWAYERPATTVVGSFCPDVISAPGYRLTESRQNAEGGVRVTVAEGGVLQSFPADYPWQGSRSKRFEQVGNAIPPLLARHILSTVLATDLAGEAVA